MQLLYTCLSHVLEFLSAAPCFTIITLIRTIGYNIWHFNNVMSGLCCITNWERPINNLLYGVLLHTVIVSLTPLAQSPGFYVKFRHSHDSRVESTHALHARYAPEISPSQRLHGYSQNTNSLFSFPLYFLGPHHQPGEFIGKNKQRKRVNGLQQGVKLQV